MCPTRPQADLSGLGYTPATLAVLLPVLALGTCICLLAVRLRCWRTAVLGGAAVWGGLLVGMTEVLGALHRLGAVELGASWFVLLVVGMVCLARDWRRSESVVSVRHHSWWRPRDLIRLQGEPAPFRGLVLGLTLLVLVLAVVAVVSPPNTWDSMTYHMARLINWMQTASLSPYPTHILRQLYLQPGAEFVLLHLQLLSGGDHLAGLVQWASMVGVLVGTSLIARRLGASTLGQLAAACVAASLPIGILESTSTQNDSVVAFWLVCAAAFAFDIMRTPRSGVPWAASCAFGASFGLALLTKATAYLYGLPVLILVTAYFLKTYAWRAVAPLAVAAVLAFALNAGAYARNLAVFGSPTGPLDEGLPNDSYLNAALTPSLLASNVVRDLGLNLIATPLAPFNVASAEVVRDLHTWLGVDSADPRTTWGNEAFVARAPGLAFDENFAGNPVHLALVGLTVLAVLFLRGSRLSQSIHWYTLALAGGFLLFSAVLRWQPWNARLELPLFVLGAPLVAAVVDRVAPRLVAPLAAVLLVSMLPWVAYNQARPIVGPRSILSVTRDDQYFTNQPSLRSAYLGAVGFLSERACDRVGFVSTPDGWEYPLWALLRQSATDTLRIEQIRVTNISSRWQIAEPSSQSSLCAVVSIDQGPNVASFDLGGRTYQPAYTTDRVTVLTPDGP